MSSGDLSVTAYEVGHGSGQPNRRSAKLCCDLIDLGTDILNLGRDVRGYIEPELGCLAF